MIVLLSAMFNSSIHHELSSAASVRITKMLMGGLIRKRSERKIFLVPHGWGPGIVQSKLFDFDCASVPML